MRIVQILRWGGGVLSHQMTKTRLVIKKNKNRKKLQAAVDLIMRQKLPHTYSEELISYGLL